MIGKTARFGSSFLGALEYCYYAVKPSRSLDRTTVRGELLMAQCIAPTLTTNGQVNINELARQFQQVARLNDRVEKPVWHQVFSFPIGERPGQATMALLTQEFAWEFGLINNPLIAFRHAEKDHDHFHIVASRVDMAGRNSALSRYNYTRISEFCRRMEDVYKLTPTVPMLTLEATEPQPQLTGDNYSTAESEANRRSTSSPTPLTSSRQSRIDLRRAIDRTIQQANSLSEFCQKLPENGPYEAQLVTYTNRQGQPRTGIVYLFTEEQISHPVPGYSLGRGYVHGQLVQRIGMASKNETPSGKDPAARTPDKQSVDVTEPTMLQLPFGGTAAAHESAIERDLARIRQSLQQTTKPVPTQNSDTTRRKSGPRRKL